MKNRMEERFETWEINTSRTVAVTIRVGEPAVWLLDEGRLLVVVPKGMPAAKVRGTLQVLRQQMEEGLF